MGSSDPTDVCFLPATELAARIRRRELSPVEVVRAYLERIEKRNPLINAYTTVLADQALEQARGAEQAVMDGDRLGALHGVPIAIKDLDDVAGVETSMGSLAVRNRIPERSAAIVERMQEAGAIVLGKTNSPEFGHKGTTDNFRFGPTSTPWVTEMNSGGSSGGSAAAVADGLAALGQGTDGGGSIRIPAAFCGVVGFKASFGRIPSVTRPDAFLWQHPYVHTGPLTRTVGDSALMLSVVAGAHERDPWSLPGIGGDYLGAVGLGVEGVRIAYSPQLGNFPVHKTVAAVVEAAVHNLAGSGINIEQAEPSFGVDHHELARLWVRQISVHYGAIAEYLKQDGLDLLGEHANELTPEFRDMLLAAPTYGAVEHRLDDLARTRVFDGLEDLLADHDFIISPTLAVPGIANSADGNTRGPVQIDGRTVDPLIGWCMTYPINFTGHPAVSVPAGFTQDGMPVGLQIIGRRYSDEQLIAMAAAIERTLPWCDSYSRLAG
jgi:Asp-tRNA(Asn)/Glu-tRNA(Gln) amidotransferase A subunit family amidase